MSIPRTDERLVPYSTNWNDRLAEDYARFGLTAEQAAKYSAVHEPYVETVAAMLEERAAGTISASRTAMRDGTRAALMGYLRELYGIVQSRGSVSDADKTVLGVVVRTSKRTRRAPPAARPGVEVVRVEQRTATLRVFDPDSATRRGRAPGAAYAWIFSHVGETCPSDASQWRFCGAASRGQARVLFPAETRPGTQVWLCATWVNRRGERGGTSTPITTHIQGGVDSMAGAGLKIAA